MVSDEKFLSKEWPQSCGDSIKVIEKTALKKGKNTLFKCCFQKYSFEIFAQKSDIINGRRENPLIEQKEFVEKLWIQNCGDTLKVLEKQKINGKTLFKCEFQKYPYIILAPKDHIKRGVVDNPEIDKKEFLDKEWLQNCGDSLKIIEKTNQKSKDNKYLWRCLFKKYPCEILATKNAIKTGVIDNPAFPWKNRESLLKYIKENFKNKVALKVLAKSLDISESLIGQCINKYNLREYIDYAYNFQEKFIEEFLKNLKVEVISNKNFSCNKKIKEIDFLITKNFLGIEYNGNYWHSDLYKTQFEHQEKSFWFKDNFDINIFHIFEYEWEFKQEIIKSLIKARLGIFNKIIYARKCELKELSNQEYQNFCEQNHLQGQAGAKVKLGLFFKDELIQIMSFGCPRFSDKFEWEIIRECSKLGYKVVGGKQKLWKYFFNNYNPSNCLSYCDFSKFTGESYLKLGFKKTRLNAPGFVWYDDNTKQIFWRTPAKHQEYKEKYLKIYDCGQLVFEWFKY